MAQLIFDDERQATGPAPPPPSGPTLVWDKSPQSEPLPGLPSEVNFDIGSGTGGEQPRQAPQSVSFDMEGKTSGQQDPVTTFIQPDYVDPHGMFAPVLSTLWPKSWNGGLFGWGNAVIEGQKADELSRRAFLAGDIKGALKAKLNNPLLWSFQTQPIEATPGSVLGAVTGKAEMAVPKMTPQPAEATVPAQAPRPEVKSALELTPEMQAPNAPASAPPLQPPELQLPKPSDLKPDPLLKNIRPPSENIDTVIDSNFKTGRSFGNDVVPINDLRGGVRLSDPSEIKRVDDLAAKIGGEKGFFRRIIVDTENNVVEGQHRLEALRKLGVENVPVVRIGEATTGLPADRMREAVKAIGGLHREQVDQIVANAADAIHEAGGADAAISNFDFPEKFKAHYEAALNAARSAEMKPTGTSEIGGIPPSQPPAPPATTGSTPPETPPELMAPRLTPQVHKSVVDAATELMDTGGVARHPAMRLSDQIADLLASNRLEPAQVATILDKHGVTFEQFSGIWREDIAQTARDLGRLGIASQKLKAAYANLTPTEQGALDAALQTEGIDLGTASQSLWKRLDNIRRASLVLQPATAARNFETQVGRVGLDGLEKMIDEALQVATGRKSITEIHPAETFATQLRLFQRNKGLVDEILQYYPLEQDKLFTRYMSDLSTSRTGVQGAVGSALDKVKGAVDFMNGLNRFQEYVVRRAVFLGELDRGVAEAGMPNLGALESAGQLHTIPQDMIQNAVTKSLEMTYAKSYSPTSLPGHFIGFINKMPGATLPIPFPRFLMNSIEFMFDYNPTGFLRLLSASQRAELAAGNFSTITKATTGTALLLTAYAVRSDPNLAGEKWYEARGPNGKTIDLRPFNPFAGYLFLADLAYRSAHGTLQNMNWKDIVSGVLSANVRAGTGLYVVDQLLNGLSGLTDQDKVERFLKGMAGETLSGPMVFMQPVRDLFAQFDDKQRVLKDTSDSPFWGPFLRKIPYGTADKPPVESPTREGPVIQQSPLLRQLTGITMNQPKNALEKELDRLGFSRHDYAPGTGDPEADRLVNKYLGIVAEKTVMPMVESPFWHQLGDRTKAFMLAKEMQDAHKDAVKMARAEDPTRFMQLDLKRMPHKERLMLRENMGIDPAEILDQMNAR